VRVRTTASTRARQRHRACAAAILAHEGVGEAAGRCVHGVRRRFRRGDERAAAVGALRELPTKEAVGARLGGAVGTQHWTVSRRRDGASGCCRVEEGQWKGTEVPRCERGGSKASSAHWG
jgi:hypothetical protein